MGRYAIIPKKWHQNWAYLYARGCEYFPWLFPGDWGGDEAFIGSGHGGWNTQYWDAAACILGGLPIFSNGAVACNVRVSWSPYWSIGFMAVRVPSTATLIKEVSGDTGLCAAYLSQGYSFGAELWSGYSRGRLRRGSTVLASTIDYPPEWGYPYEAECRLECNGTQLVFKYTHPTHGQTTLLVSDATYSSGHIGFGAGHWYAYVKRPRVHYGGTSPVWPTENIAYLRYRVLRGGNPVQGAEVVAVHHKLAEMMASNTSHAIPPLPKVGIVRGTTGADGWVELPLDTDDGPWMAMVRYPDSNMWYTAEGKPGRMPTLY